MQVGLGLGLTLYQGGGGLIPRGGWALGSTRLALPGGSAAATATNTFQIAEIAVPLPDWSGQVRLLLSAASFTNGALVPLANSLVVDWLTIRRGSEFYPVTVGSSVAFTFGPSDLVWSDPVAGFTSVPGETVLARYELNTPNTTRYPVAFYPVLGGHDLGEGRLAGTLTAARPDLRTGGTIPSTTPSNAQVWGPSAVAVSGYDGSSHVMLLFGDSRDVGQNDIVVRAADRGCMGGAARGLDDAASGRMAFANMSVRGARATTFAANLEPIWTALGALPNRLFHDVLMSINGNDINGTAPVATLDDMKAADIAMWAHIQTKAPDARIYHCFGQPWTSDTSGNLYSTVADQTPAAASTAPNGLLQQTNDWLASGVGVPSYVTPIDLRSAVQDSGSPDRWPAPGITGTLVSAASRTVVADLSAPPPKGDQVVISVGPNALSLTVTDVTNVGGRYTMTTAEGVTGTHVAADIVAIAPVKDGVHESQTLAKAEAAVIAARKLDGTIRAH